jgi:hypothetical protein
MRLIMKAEVKWPLGLTHAQGLEICVCAHSVHIAGGVMEGKLHTGALIINSRAVPENSAPAANVGNKTICAPSLPAPDAPPL